MATASKKTEPSAEEKAQAEAANAQPTEPSAEEKARAEAANAQPTEDTTRAGGHILTDRGWVIEHPQATEEDSENA